MTYLAARIPPGWDVIHFDEEAEQVNWSIEADVVGITFHTPSAFHAYQIAAGFGTKASVSLWAALMSRSCLKKPNSMQM